MRLKEGEKGFINYRNCDDEELVCLACQGDLIAEECLINKYKKLVKIKARSYFLIGADTEDIIQEGMIGLYKAFLF
jgi:RNA polymerase sporulation-specific sigma factor